MRQPGKTTLLRQKSGFPQTPFRENQLEQTDFSFQQFPRIIEERMGNLITGTGSAPLAAESGLANALPCVSGEHTERGALSFSYLPIHRRYSVGF